MSRDSLEPGRGSVLTDVLTSITRFASSRPRLTLWLTGVTVLLSIAASVQFVSFKTKRSDLIDDRADFQQRWLNYTANFDDVSELVVVVEADRRQTAIAVLEDLGTRLQAEPKLFTKVVYKLDASALRSKGLQLCSPEQLERGLKRVVEYGPVLDGRWDLVGLTSLIGRLDYQIASRAASAAPEQLTPLLGHAGLLASSMDRYVRDENNFQSPWPTLLPANRQLTFVADGPTYLLSERGNMGFLRAQAVSDGNGFNGPSKAIARLREIIHEIEPKYSGATIGVTGIPVLESDEMRRSQWDMTLASIISAVGVGLILVVGFRGFRHPLLIMIILAVGMSWTFGYAALAVGSLNILSVAFTSMLIGIGIDFAIHYLAHYVKLRHEQQTIAPALAQTSGDVGTGIITAGVTAALAFFCVTFTEFRGVAELGVIAGGGILLCVVATFVVLPALVAVVDRRIEPAKIPAPFEANILRRLTARFPRLVLVASLVLTFGVGACAIEYRDGRLRWRVRYDYNLLKLQADGLEAVEVQKRLFQEANDSLLYAVAIADAPQEARALRERFLALESVDHVEDLASLVPGNTAGRTRSLIQAYQMQFSRLPRQQVRLADPDPASVGRSLEKLLVHVRGIDHPRAQPLAVTLDAFLDRFEKLPLAEQTRFLSSYQLRSTAALQMQFQALASATNTQPIVWSEVPEELRSRFVGKDGRWLLQIYPKEQIWDVEPLTRFVADVRSVDPNVTGTPIQNYEASRQIFASYEDAALYAFALIFLVLLIDFLAPEHKMMTLLAPLALVLFAMVTLYARRIEINFAVWAVLYVAIATAVAAYVDRRHLRDSALAILPPLLGTILMFGFLALAKIDLNPANLIVLPLILGIGLDEGVLVIHDFRLQRGKYSTSGSTVNAIILTSTTTMVGFGSMMVAAHRGLYSVGLVLLVGTVACVFVALVTLPAVLTIISQRGTGARSDSGPMTARSLLAEKKRQSQAA